MAYDPVRHETVLFGGEDDHASLGDTWTWDGHGWSRDRSATSPTPREGASMIYDPTLGAVLLLGGVTYRSGPGCPDPYAEMLRRSDSQAGAAPGGALSPYVDTCPPPVPRQDMWAWDGHTWHSIGQEPIPGHIGGVAWDARQRDIVAIGIGLDTWIWKGQTWSSSPAAHVIDSPDGLNLTTDYRTGRPLLLLFELGPPCDEGASAPAPSPGNHERRSPGLSSEGGMINCGVTGDGHTYTGYAASTWTWTGAAWAQVFTSDMPFPGSVTSGVAAPAVLLGRSDRGQSQTWTWSGVDWMLSVTSSAPPLEDALTPGAIADGPQSGSAVYFAPGDPCIPAPGGSPSGCSVAAPPGNSTWIWDGKVWSRV